MVSTVVLTVLAILSTMYETNHATFNYNLCENKTLRHHDNTLNAFPNMDDYHIEHVQKYVCSVDYL